jgi:DNA-binding HxlR family transcriptional regulator
LPGQPILPSVPFKPCPTRTSLEVLSNKWTMLILRDIGFLKVDRFKQMLGVTPGLTSRVLTLKLRELESDGYIRPLELQSNPPLVRWGLIKKGEDALRVLMSLIDFGSKWYSEEVFEDKRSRSVMEPFPSLPYGR